MKRLVKPDQINPYLSDASQFTGEASAVLLPENEKEISELFKEANARKIPVTVSGGRTGLVGAAVPQGGWVLSSEKFSRIQQIHKDPAGADSWVRLEPAILLKDLDEALLPHRLFYPPDPTGPKAFLGGTLATNASGPNSFKYGATRRYVRWIRVVLATGDLLELRRGQIRANQNGILEIPLKSAAPLKIAIPSYRWPRIKHAGGYFAGPGMDAVDLFIGSEGTLGVVTEIELALLPRPEGVWASVVFFQREEDAWQLARDVGAYSNTPLHPDPRILEYFDAGSLDFLRPSYPSIPKAARACVFVEQEVGARRAVPLQRDLWHQFFEKAGALDEIWEGETAEKQREFRAFRSALPLAVKDFLAEHHQVKVGTDTCVPHDRFEELMRFHRESVEKLKVPSVTFGHIGECHVHLNLFPRNPDESRRARSLYPELVKQAMALGGTFSAEHGVGKLKRSYLVQLLGEKAIQEMRALKRIFDPNLILGQGNLFEIE